VTAFDPNSIRALVFDVFGTVVDWHGSIAAEAIAFGTAKGIPVDGGRFALGWRAGYRPAMQRVRSGELPWTTLDRLHRIMLDEVLAKGGITGLSDAELEMINLAWHRLYPWPDSVPGLTRLKTKFIIAPLSNGNISLITNMAKFAGLPWDCVLGAELARAYKPDVEVYLSAARFLDLQPSEVMMVAAHSEDLRVAASLGLRTAFVHRPLEYGEGDPYNLAEHEADGPVDLSVQTFVELAERLGA
jgi:2-haloacid dehalogenase